MAGGTRKGVAIVSTIRWGYDDGSWRTSLHDKATFFERDILEKHWSEGLYPSMVEVRSDGTVDYSTQGFCDVAHSCCWTANYLAGQAYRYLATKDESVREHCWHVLRAFRRLQKLTGIPGLICRGYLLGHGPVSAERGGSDSSEYWRQGKGELSGYRWRGDQSHHNYDAVMHGYGAYYSLAANHEQKEFIREDVRAIGNYVCDNDLLIRDVDGRTTCHLLGLGDARTPNLRTIMATHGLKVAHYVCGDRKFADKYEELVDRFGYRERAGFEVPPPRTDFDDAEHVFGDLDNLLRMETDPGLLRFYRVVLDALWEAHKNDRCAFYCYLYGGQAGSEDCDRDGALWDLRHWPVTRRYTPRMNSIRRDIEFVTNAERRRVARDPLPMNERPMDNEYQWKGSPYALDGWLARPIVALQVAAEDPAVIHCLDAAGVVYRSLDKGGTWQEMTPVPAGMRDLAVADRRFRFMVAATGQGVFRSNSAGCQWERALVPGTSTYRVLASKEGYDHFYAISDAGIYQSLDLGPLRCGQGWKQVAPPVPGISDARYAVVCGTEAVCYAATRTELFMREAGGDGWRRAGVVPFAGEGIEWIRTDPNNRKVVFVRCRLLHHGPDYHILWKTTDAGANWMGIIADGLAEYAGFHLDAHVGGEGLEGDIQDLVVPSGESYLLAATSLGIFRSDDGGDTWREWNGGLHITSANRLFDRQPDGCYYASTPAGLFRSRDGESWEYANLCLNVRSCAHYECGAADYTIAYWMGRHYGFITEKEATQSPDRWNCR
jgi:photosystem II stability/assembly factor-like uncharacterized protein